MKTGIEQHNCGKDTAGCALQLFLFKFMDIIVDTAV